MWLGSFVFVCVWLRENVRAVEHERERERDWLADRRRETHSRGTKQQQHHAVGVDAASESGRARRLCV